MNIYHEESFRSRFNRTKREEYARWIGGLGFNVSVTLNFNTFEPLDCRGYGGRHIRSPATVNTAREALKGLFFKVDKRLLGRHFLKLPKRRTRGIFTLERVQSNIHAHGLIFVERCNFKNFFEMLPTNGRGIWTKVFPSGTQYTKPAHDPYGFAAYMMKEQFFDSDPDKMIFLEEFHPSK